VEGNLKEGGEIRSVVTQADIDAHARNLGALIGALRQTWGEGIRIIGEEDDDNPKLEGIYLNKHILKETSLEDEQIPIEEITLFVNPLDGT